MIQRFGTFVTSITQLYRSIHKIKNKEMTDFGLKGIHVMYLFQLQQHPEGLTSAQLSHLCAEDKAAVSRALSELHKKELTAFAETDGQRRYRTPIILTEKGRAVAERMKTKITKAVDTGAGGYSEEERAIFYKVLLTVSENLQKACEEEGL